MAVLQKNGSLKAVSTSEEDSGYYKQLHYLSVEVGYYDADYQTRKDNLTYDGTELYRNGTLQEVFGKVIYERIISHEAITTTNPAYENNQFKGSKIKFNWKIESQLPPTYFFKKTGGTYQVDFPGGSTGTGWAAVTFFGQRAGWPGLYNSRIKNVVIRIRKLTGARTADGGITFVTNDPFSTSEYVEVGKIIIIVDKLGTPPEDTLNDTNRGYHKTDRNYVLNKSRLATGELKGYSDESIEVDTANNTVTHNSVNLPITWLNGHSKFESNEYYYLTLEPENHPVKKILESTGAEYEDTNFDKVKPTTDGWYGIQKVWPFHYRLANATSIYEGLTEQVYQDNWKLINRFKSGTTAQGGWTNEANNIGGVSNTKKISDILGKLKDTKNFWSQNDMLIDDTEFHMYGFNIRSYAEQLFSNNTWYDARFTSRDKIEKKAEYFAWFKTPQNKAQANITFDITKASKATERAPYISKEKAETLEDLTPTTKEATVYGRFYYQNFDFYLESEFSTQVTAAIAAQQSQNAAQIQAEIDKIKGTPKLPGEKPKKCGFRYRNKNGSDNKWYDVLVRSDLTDFKYNAFTRELPTDAITRGEGSPDASVFFYFKTKLPIIITVADAFEYQIWVEKTNPVVRYYSEPSQLETQATNYPIQFGNPTFKDFQDPNPKDKGFWYQMYNCWKLVSTDNIRTQIPYLTRKTDIVSEPKQLEKIPVHYYMNMTFTNNTNYQFRTTLESHVHGQNTSKTDAEVNDSTLSELHIVLPWSENLKIETPYINKNLSTVSLADKALIPNINVYMYSNINGYSLSNLKSVEPSSSSTDLASKPRNFIMSKHNPKNPITYTANMKFTQSLSYVGIAKSDWFIQGFATFNILNQVNIGSPNVGKGSELVPYFIDDEPMGGKGWHWLEKDAAFVWFDKVAPSNNLPDIDSNKNLPIGGNVYDYFSDKKSSIKYLLNNFIARFIIYQKFNLSFDYLNNTPFGMSMYMGKKLPYIKSSTEWYVTNTEELIASGQLTLLGKLGRSTNGQTQKCKFYGLEGNQYLVFVADPVIAFNQADTTGAITRVLRNFNILPTSTIVKPFKSENDGYQLSNGRKSFGTYSVIRLSNFVLTSNYHEKNNVVVDVNSLDSSYSPRPEIINASYSITLGEGNNVFQDQVNLTTTYTAKAGNSTFRSGVWENGVWNNGWREDLTIKEFYRVKEFYSFNKDRVWRVKIEGSTKSTIGFSIGDRVSIGNITAIDINDKRKFLKKYYYVIDVQSDYIEFEFVSEFPIKRIERDSDEHRIMVSKNIWMNGVFFNGYFKGIWNNGIFSGYPRLAKMDESQWIDGTFNGGHFTAKKYSINLSSVKIASFDNVPRLSLVTSTPHGLTKDDTISVTYSLAGGIKYLGTTLILATPTDTEITTGILWEEKFASEITTGGTILTVISTGLIQNFNFYSRNISRVTSLDTMVSESVFSYDSWIDVNYSNQSAVNIGRPQSNTEPYSKRSFAENNLYGYPTTDVLSSYSLFRDSFSLSYRKYRLGSKFEIFSDYVGSPSAFEDWFDSTETDKGKKQFESQGWSYKKLKNNSIEIYAASQSVVGTKLKITLTDTPLISNLTIGNGLFGTGSDIVIVGPGYDDSYEPPLDVIYKDNAKVESVNRVGDVWEVGTNDTRAESQWNLTGTFKIGLTGSSSITFSRTPEPITTDTAIQGKELKVNVSGTGGILDLIPNYNVSNRKNGTDQTTTDGGKYTMVEFDLVDYLTATNSTNIERANGISHTPLHFNNLNFVSREIQNNIGLSEEFIIEATYLPVYKNINHLTTFGKKKQEFFFNKRNLMMNAQGVGSFGNYELELYIDNLKFYEVNMIPFFQYFRDPGDGVGNINISIQPPMYGIAPVVVFGEDEIVDTETPNEIISYFTDKLISNNIDAPLGVNWEQDYAIYRTQINDIDDPTNIYTKS